MSPLTLGAVDHTPPDPGAVRVSLRTDVVLAVEEIGVARVHTAGGERSEGGLTAGEDVGQQEDGVGDVDRTRVVRVERVETSRGLAGERVREGQKRRRYS